MKVWLKKLVLYGYGGETRTISFERDRLSIITEESKTGKSAIIHIINYCLGSDQCHVPEGVIRRKVSWYGVLLARSGKDLFVGRQNPEQGRTTSSSIYIRSGEYEDIPGILELSKNVNLEGLKELLTRFVGIDENLHVPGPDHTRSPLAANVSHAKIYCFQEQSVIDSKNTLFFEQTDSFVAQAIKDTLPYFLGAVSTYELMKQQELLELRKNARLIERQLDSRVSWEQAAEPRAAALWPRHVRLDWCLWTSGP